MNVFRHRQETVYGLSQRGDLIYAGQKSKPNGSVHSLLQGFGDAGTTGAAPL